MADVIFECPKCKQRLEAPPDMMGQPIPCPTCKFPLKVPYSKEALQTVKFPQVPSPISGYYNSRFQSLLRAIKSGTHAVNELTQSILVFQAHSNQYYCSRCNSWVDPHFDYEQVSSGGGGFIMPNGLVVVRQNTSTSEFVRCSKCGIRINQDSGAELANRHIKLYNTAFKRLQRLRRREQKWHKINQLKESRPRLSAFLRFIWGFPWIFPLLIILVLIGVAVVSLQRQAASALLIEENSVFESIIRLPSLCDRRENLRSFIAKYPKGTHFSQATAMFNELEWVSKSAPQSGATSDP